MDRQHFVLSHRRAIRRGDIVSTHHLALSVGACAERLVLRALHESEFELRWVAEARIDRGKKLYSCPPRAATRKVSLGA